MKYLMIAAFALVFTMGCSSQKTAATNERPAGRQGGAPNFSQLLAEMDSNKDGQLSKSEVKGPIQNDFSKIDSNADGFISETEFKNAPKPQRRQGPSRNK